MSVLSTTFHQHRALVNEKSVVAETPDRDKCKTPHIFLNLCILSIPGLYLTTYYMEAIERKAIKIRGLRPFSGGLAVSRSGSLSNHQSLSVMPFFYRRTKGAELFLYPTI